MPGIPRNRILYKAERLLGQYSTREYQLKPSLLSFLYAYHIVTTFHGKRCAAEGVMYSLYLVMGEWFLECPTVLESRYVILYDYRWEIVNLYLSSGWDEYSGSLLQYKLINRLKIIVLVVSILRYISILALSLYVERNFNRIWILNYVNTKNCRFPPEWCNWSNLID